MKVLLDAVTILVVGLVFVAIATLSLRWPFSDTARGELRCEGRGAIVLNVAGKEYAVNGMAGGRYPPVQQVWNNAAYPDTNIDLIISRGLTLCDW